MKNELTAKRMQLALSNANMIPQELSEKSGVSKSSISQYVNGSHAPSNISSGKMGKVLGVNPLWLMGFDVDMKKSIIEDKSEELKHKKTSQYEHIIDKYLFVSTHSPDGAKIVEAVLNREWAVAKQISEQKIYIEKLKMKASAELTPSKTITYFHRIASAGSGEYLFDDMPTDLIKVKNTPESAKADFVIGVNGKSMEPDYYDGEKVFVELTSNIEIGEVGVFVRGNECFIKEYGKEGLVSKNANYPGIEPFDDGIKIVGKVIGKVTEII